MGRHKHTEAWDLFLDAEQRDKMQCLGTGSQDRPQAALASMVTNKAHQEFFSALAYVGKVPRGC